MSNKLGASLNLASFNYWILLKLVFPLSLCTYCILTMCYLLIIPVSTTFLGAWLLFWSCSFFSLCWSYNYVWIRIPRLSSTSLWIFIQISTCLTWEYIKGNKSSIQKWRYKSKIGKPWKKTWMNRGKMSSIALKNFCISHIEHWTPSEEF